MPYKNVISYKYIGCLGRRFVANTAGNVSYASVSVLIFNYMEQGIFLALCVYVCVGKEGGGGGGGVIVPFFYLLVGYTPYGSWTHNLPIHLTLTWWGTAIRVGACWCGSTGLFIYISQSA